MTRSNRIDMNKLRRPKTVKQQLSAEGRYDPQWERKHAWQVAAENSRRKKQLKRFAEARTSEDMQRLGAFCAAKNHAKKAKITLPKFSWDKEEKEK